MNKTLLLKAMGQSFAIVAAAVSLALGAHAVDYPAKVINAYDHNGNVVSAQIVSDTKYIEIEDVKLDPKTFVVNGIGGTATFKMIPVVGAETYSIRNTGVKWPVAEKARVLKTYYIGETEVTQGLWKAIMGNTTGNADTDLNLPVNNISWEDICGEGGFLEYLNRELQTDPELGNLANGRVFCLPTRWEWEYAVSGGNLHETFRYSGSDNVDEVAWTANNSEGTVHPVKQLKPNGLGIYDMTGNVWELCEDVFRNNDGEYNEANRGMGGMNYTSNVANNSGLGFSSCSTTNKSLTIGFRLVLREQAFQPDFNTDKN